MYLISPPAPSPCIVSPFPCHTRHDRHDHTLDTYSSSVCNKHAAVSLYREPAFHHFMRCAFIIVLFTLS